MNRRLLLFLSILTVSVAQFHWRWPGYHYRDDAAPERRPPPPVRRFFREDAAPPPPPKGEPKEKHSLGGAESVSYHNGFCGVYIGWCSGAYYWNGYQWWPKYNNYNNRYHWNGYRWVW